MPRPPIGERAMTSTERTHRQRERLAQERAREKEITRRYFGGRPPLSPQERRRLLRENGRLLAHDARPRAMRQRVI
jgi:hypothetical protein